MINARWCALTLRACWRAQPLPLNCVYCCYAVVFLRGGHILSLVIYPLNAPRNKFFALFVDLTLNASPSECSRERSNFGRSGLSTSLQAADGPFDTASSTSFLIHGRRHMSSCTMLDGSNLSPQMSYIAARPRDECSRTCFLPCHESGLRLSSPSFVSHRPQHSFSPRRTDTGAITTHGKLIALLLPFLRLGVSMDCPRVCVGRITRRDYSHRLRGSYRGRHIRAGLR